MRAACNPHKEKEDEKHCLFSIYCVLTGLPWCLSSNPPANSGDVGSIPGSERSPGEGPTPVFLPRKSHGQRRLEGCLPWGHKEPYTT